MDINFKSLIKEQIVFILLPFILLFALIGGTGYTGFNAFNAFNDSVKKEGEITSLEEQKASLETQLAEQKKIPEDPNAKKIYSLEGTQFGADASFAPLFDNMLLVAKKSGIRIRSVKYNYKPSEDPIYKMSIPGNNVCELSSVMVGNYESLQKFIKTILSEDYLVNLVKLELVPWKKDKSILIAYVKLRFYTKTN